MSGWGRGFCASGGSAVPRGAGLSRGLTGPFARCGRGFGLGGRGWRNQYNATGMTRWQRSAAPPAQTAMDLESEKQFLQNQAHALRDELDAIDKRLEEIASSDNDQ
jgi:hypothetical protein